MCVCGGGGGGVGVCVEYVCVCVCVLGVWGVAVYENLSRCVCVLCE